MRQTPTFAFLNENDSPVEFRVINKNQHMKKNSRVVLAVLQKIADGGKK